MRVFAKQPDFQHPSAFGCNFSVFVLTCIDSPDFFRVHCQVFSNCPIILYHVWVSLPHSMSFSSRLMVTPYLIESLAYELGINCYKLQYSSKKHFIEGDGSILKFMLTKIVYNNHCRKSKSKELLFEIIS